MTVFHTKHLCTTNDESFYKNKVLRHNLRAAAVHSIYLRIAMPFQLQW